MQSDRIYSETEGSPQKRSFGQFLSSQAVAGADAKLALKGDRKLGRVRVADDISNLGHSLTGLPQQLFRLLHALLGQIGKRRDAKHCLKPLLQGAITHSHLLRQGRWAGRRFEVRSQDFRRVVNAGGGIRLQRSRWRSW